jgi:antitoxin HigA-1
VPPTAHPIRAMNWPLPTFYKRDYCQEGDTPMEMCDPAHPGRVFQEYLEGMNITHVANHLHAPCLTPSTILNCRAGISAEMSLRLSAALGTHPSFGFDMQSPYEFAQARRKKIPPIAPFGMAA